MCVIFSSKFLIFVDIPKSRLSCIAAFQVFGGIMAAYVPFAEAGRNKTETQATGVYIIGLYWKKVHSIL